MALSTVLGKTLPKTLAKVLTSLGADATVSATLSTFTLDTYEIDADSLDAATPTIVARNASSILLADKLIVLTAETITISAANSFITVDVSEIADDGVQAVNISLFLLDESGRAVPTIAAADCGLAVSGSGNTLTLLDTHTDQNGRMRATLTSTTAEEKTITAAPFGDAITDEETITVSTEAPAGPSAVFESSWSDSTGTSVDALTDGGTWGSLGCPSTAPSIMTVVDGTALGWTRTANVLRCLFEGAGPCGMLEQSDAVPLSTTFYVQFWFRNDDEGSKNDHPVAMNNLHFSGDIQAVPFTRHANNSNGAVAGEWVTAVVVNGSKCFSPPLDNETWYRFEYMIEFVTGTTIKMHPRIYSDAGVLLYTAVDFIYPPGGYANLQAAYDGGVVHTLTDAELARDWGMGQEGPGGQPNTGGYFYYGAPRLGTAGWFNGDIGSLT